MVKCPICNTTLEHKEGEKKFAAQIGNPEIAIIKTNNPHFCGGCNEYYLKTEDIAKAVVSVSVINKKQNVHLDIATGIYK